MMPMEGLRSAGRRTGGVAACLVVVIAGTGAVCQADEVLKPLRVLGDSGFHHAGSLSEIVVLADGKRFLSSARDGSARLWDLRSGRELRRYVRKVSDDVWGLLVLPGGKELLTASGDGFVTRWNLETGEELRSYEHGSTVFRLALRPGGTEFVGTDNENVAILWNLESGEKIRTFKGHTDSVYTAVFSPDGKKLLTGASDGKLKVWEVESGKCLRTYKEDLEDVFTLQASPDGKRFASCSADNKLRVFEIETLDVVWEKKMKDGIKVASWSPDGSSVATACEDGGLYVFDSQSGKRQGKFSVPHDSHTPIAFTADGKGLLSGGDFMIYHHDAETGKRIMPEAGDPMLLDGVAAVALSGDGGFSYAVGADDVIQVWETASGSRVKSIAVGSPVESMMVSRDGELLATGEEDGAVRLRSAKTGDLKRELPCEGMVEQIVLARNDGWLFAVGTDDQVHLWETATGRKVRSFTGHTNDVNAIAVSRDGQTLVSVSDDQTARLWDVESGKLLREFAGVDESLRYAAALDDGRSFLISANEPELWGWLAPAVEAAGELPRAEVDRLVGELVSESFAARDSATKALISRGEQILPLLESLEPDDPETAYRLRHVKARIRTAQYEGELTTLHKFEKDLYGLGNSPDGRYWMAIVGAEADSRIVLGEARDGKLKILQEISDGHSPSSLSFSADGKILAAGNRDGSVSLFAVAGGG